MPVNLPPSPHNTTLPIPPRLWVWVIAIPWMTLAGAALVLLNWPQERPTHDAWFWACVLAFPALASCAIYGLRRHYWEQESERIEAEVGILAKDRDAALRFAQQPLALVRAAHLSAIEGHSTLDQASANSSGLAARATHSGDAVTRHTALDVDGLTTEERYASCFTALLNKLASSLACLPSSSSLEVRLHLPRDTPREALAVIWNDCWRAIGLRPAKLMLTPPYQGIMALDAWLDRYGIPAQGELALHVAVQLHPNSPANSAEAAVAILIATAPSPRRMEITAQACLHRPVEVKYDVTNALTFAMLCGNAIPDDIGSVWQTGLTATDATALLKAASSITLDLSPVNGPSLVHNIDEAIGDSGAAAVWLALALATENAAKTGKANLLASRQHALRLAIIQPVDKSL